MKAGTPFGGLRRSPDMRWWRAGPERSWWRRRDWGEFCRHSTGLAKELDVGVRGREKLRITPNLWLEKLAGGGTICKTKRKGGLWEGEKLRILFWLLDKRGNRY